MIPLHDDNPSTIKPLVSWAILAVNVLVFLWELGLGVASERMVYSFGLIPAVLFENKHLTPDLNMIPAWLTVFTSMFLHGGWLHLLGNMLYLWIFANNIEDAMGHVRFLVFYLLCGVSAAMVQSLADPTSVVPMIGASGAISGVLGAYMLLFPHARVLVLIPLGFFMYTMRLPAVVVLVFWFVLQLLSSAMAAGQQGGVAFAAHIGGFIAGMLLIPFFKYPRFKLIWQR